MDRRHFLSTLLAAWASTRGWPASLPFAWPDDGADDLTREEETHLYNELFFGVTPDGRPTPAGVGVGAWLPLRKRRTMVRAMLAEIRSGVPAGDAITASLEAKARDLGLL